MMLLLLVKMLNCCNSHGILDHQSVSHCLQVWMVPWHHHWASLVPLSSSQEGSIVEHILSLRIKRPEVSFTRIAWFTRHLDKTVIETQIMSD